VTSKEFAEAIGRGMAQAFLGEKEQPRLARGPRKRRAKAPLETQPPLPFKLGPDDLPGDDDLRQPAAGDAYSLDSPLTLEAIERLASEARPDRVKAREESELRERLGLADKKKDDTPSLDLPSVSA
jgi:hypothetical protein